MKTAQKITNNKNLKDLSLNNIEKPLKNLLNYMASKNQLKKCPDQDNR